MNHTRLSFDELFPERLPSSFIRRADATIKFIRNPVCPAMDCGENNLLAGIMRRVFLDLNGIKSVSVDFDRVAVPQKWNTIFCFEVLEHLYNPLFFLEGMRDALCDNGRIYLSTPYQWPQFLKAVHHFHEIPTDRLMWLFDEAGLAIVRQAKITIAGRWYEHLHGFRPVLRYFQKTRIFELRKG